MADYSETAAAAARRQNGGATSHLGDNANMQEQIDKLQEQIKTMSDSMSKLTENKMNQAKATARDLVKTGQQMADDLSSQAGAYEGQLEDAIRERPLVAVAGAIGIGFIMASLLRRH
ncbi:MAG TPA: hypothetical protein VHB74_02165 [Devosia sp.]|jgi:ElaB/YqjD/DUF883 family membrane-anchored ribosome-binding protein|nr:hypothetical protein [Devosia sp.]